MQSRHQPDRLETEVERPLTRIRRLFRWFRGHKLGGLAAAALVVLFLSALFADFLSPYPPHLLDTKALVPPMRVHMVDENGGLRWPYVCAIEQQTDISTGRKFYREDCSQKATIRLFVPGYHYKLLGLFDFNLHLFGTTDPEVPFFLFGTDSLGRDVFSRILAGSRASLGISLLAVLVSLLIALPLGTLAGYCGGRVDTIIQGLTDTTLILPRLALLLVLASAVKDQQWRLWGMIAVLALVGWAPLARMLRARVLALREAEFVKAAQALGAGHGRILLRHLLPQTSSTVIISATLAAPNILMLEIFLSYLKYGVPETMVSWGLLLREIRDYITQLFAYYPWLLIPAGFVVITVLAFNFLGDALRDAFDPVSQNTR